MTNPIIIITKIMFKEASGYCTKQFCLHSQADIFKPYEKHHSTVKDACQLAEQLNVENLLLYHTEDKNITNRKNFIQKKDLNSFSGNLYIPDDLENIDI